MGHPALRPRIIIIIICYHRRIASVQNSDTLAGHAFLTVKTVLAFRALTTPDVRRLSIGIMPYRSSSFFPSVARNRITIRRTRAGTHYYNDDAYLYNIFITARLQDRTIVEQRTKSPQNVYGNIHAIRCFPKSFRRNSRTHAHAPRAENILAQLSVQKYYHFIRPLVHA